MCVCVGGVGVVKGLRDRLSGGGGQKRTLVNLKLVHDVGI